MSNNNCYCLAMIGYGYMAAIFNFLLITIITVWEIKAINRQWRRKNELQQNDKRLFVFCLRAVPSSIYHRQCFYYHFTYTLFAFIVWIVIKEKIFFFSLKSIISFIWEKLHRRLFQWCEFQKTKSATWYDTIQIESL